MTIRLLFIACLIISFESTAQVFQKKDYFVGTAFSVGGYEASSQLGSRRSISSASMGGLEFRYEYNLLDHIGIGMILRPRKFSTGDTLIEKGKHTGIYFSNILHLVNAKRLDLSLELHYGPSFLKSKDNPPVIKGSGFNYVAGLRTAAFFNNHAFFVTLAYANYPTTITRYEFNRLNLINRDSGESYNINFSGGEVTVGYLIRLNKF